MWSPAEVPCYLCISLDTQLVYVRVWSNRYASQTTVSGRRYSRNTCKGTGVALPEKDLEHGGMSLGLGIASPDNCTAPCSSQARK